VTGGDTHHYTTENLIVKEQNQQLSKMGFKKIMNASVFGYAAVTGLPKQFAYSQVVHYYA